MERKLISMLKKVQKPARYVGCELCMPVVNPEPRVKFCMCVPDLYESGICDIPAQTIYHLLNDRKGYACERCYAPYVDFARELKKENYPLFSLENRTPLAKFDLLNFQFRSEMQYTTFLYMLSLANIPLEAGDRFGGEYPLVFASGITTLNPEPIADFIDFAIIGDQEDLTVKVVDTILKCKLSKLTRSETLKRLALVDGVYVPDRYKFSYKKSGDLESVEGPVVKRQIIRDFDRIYAITKPLVANERAKHERGTIEIMRGCTRGCRFCREGFMFRPIRERRVQNLVAQANAQIFQSGVEEVAITSLSNEDYSHLPELIGFMENLCKEKNVKFSMPSLKQEMFKEEITTLAGRNAFKMSLEAGTERLRNIINRNISDEEIFSDVTEAFKNGVSLLKLNFMIGLPYETAEDLMGIVLTVKNIQELYKKHKTENKPLNISVAIETFIPKPDTPFQWCQFIGVKEAKKRQIFLTYAFKKLGIKLVFREPENSEVEAVLSRADRRVGKILKTAFLNGAIFDFDNEFFNASAYQIAYEKSGVNKELFLKKFDKDSVFAYEKIDTGINKAFLYHELEKAKAGKPTSDCRHGCNGCGLLKTGVCVNGRC